MRWAQEGGQREGWHGLGGMGQEEGQECLQPQDTLGTRPMEASRPGPLSRADLGQRQDGSAALRTTTSPNTVKHWKLQPVCRKLCTGAAVPGIVGRMAERLKLSEVQRHEDKSVCVAARAQWID